MEERWPEPRIMLDSMLLEQRTTRIAGKGHLCVSETAPASAAREGSQLTLVR